MDDSRLTALPPELRNKIYTLTFQHRCIPIAWRCHPKKSKTKPTSSLLPFTTHPQRRTTITWASPRTRRSHPLALLRTCRTFRTEATRLFYFLNTFQLLCASDANKRDLLLAFLTQIGPQNIQALQPGSLVIHTGRHDIPSQGLSAAMAQLLLFQQDEKIQKRSPGLPSLHLQATGPGAWWNHRFLGAHRRTTLELSGVGDIGAAVGVVADVMKLEAEALVKEEEKGEDESARLRLHTIVRLGLWGLDCYDGVMRAMREEEWRAAEGRRKTKLGVMVAVLLVLGFGMQWWVDGGVDGRAGACL